MPINDRNLPLSTLLRALLILLITKILKIFLTAYINQIRLESEQLRYNPPHPRNRRINASPLGTDTDSEDENIENNNPPPSYESS